jgi:hypothetical protein
MSWGDRWSRIVDAFGHAWGIGTHRIDLTAAQIRKAGEDGEPGVPQAGRPG